LRLSRLLRRPSALFASGIGPLLGTQATARVRRSLGSVSHVGLRDTRSQKLLQEIGLPSSHLFLGADASFLLPLPPPSRALFLRRALGIPDRTDLLGVILRETATCEELNALLSAIRSVCRRHGLPPLITVLDCKQDRALSRLTARRWKDLGAVCVIPTGVQDALALLSSCRAVLSMRLHGMLLAARVGTPSFGISSDACDEKIPAFAEQTNQPWLPLATLSKERATQALETLLSSADAVRPHLQSLADEMQKNAQKDLAKLLQIVYNKR